MSCQLVISSQLVISHTIAYPEVICCESEERTRVVLDVARKLQLPYVTFAAATIRDLCWCVRSIYTTDFCCAPYQIHSRMVTDMIYLSYIFI